MSTQSKNRKLRPKKRSIRNAKVEEHPRTLNKTYVAYTIDVASGKCNTNSDVTNAKPLSTFDIQSELEYLDEFHMFVDGWDLWAIPMHRMIDLIQEDTVVVLNKEDFLKDCHQAIEAFSNKMDGLFAPNIKGENE